jgi:integrase
VTDSTVLLPGVDRHGNAFRVRIRFGAHRHVEIFGDPDRANARVLELKALRDNNLLPASAPDDPRIAEIADVLLKRKASRISPKTGRKLRQTTIDWWTRIVQPWSDEFGTLRVSQLRLSTVDEVIAELALTAIPEANARLTGIKAVLRLAESRGANVDRSILALEEIPHTARERVALTAEDLEFFVARAPEHGRRMLLFKGTVGNRWSELATLVDDRFDADERTIFIPAGLCKEATDKTIDLTVEEVQLVREQQLARPAGARHIFCTATGLTWNGRYGEWHRKVWAKTVTKAARDWRALHEREDDDDTPFEWGLRDESDEPLVDDDGEPVFDRLEPHDLRATAITLMRDAGFTKEQTAARVGHADSGQLIDRIYDRGDRRTRAGVRAAIDSLAPMGIRAKLFEPRPRPSDRPAAAGLEALEGR